MKLNDVINVAIWFDDLDEAVRRVQDRIKVETGDFATMWWCGRCILEADGLLEIDRNSHLNEDEAYWKLLSLDQRRCLLNEYVTAELRHMADQMEDA